jgi:FkbM family methyltransferase
MSAALARYLVSLLPGKDAIIKGGALLPPSLRSVMTVKFLSAVAACVSRSVDLDTNLGIDRRLHLRISSSKPSLVFGKPQLFLGERSSLDLALMLFQKCECFLDVGANVGMYVFYLRSHDMSSRPIYFFEPDPTLFARLQQNVDRNGFENVKGIEIAMAEKAGKATFFQNKTDDSSGTLVKDDASQHVFEATEVGLISFADFVTRYGLEHICAKVDVEGAEELFLEGAKSHLGRLDYLIIEILGPAAGRGLPLRLMQEGNYQAYYINDYDLEHSPEGKFAYVAPFYNWLFCRESPAGLHELLQGTRFCVIAGAGSRG